MTSSTSSAQLEPHLEVSCFQQVMGMHAAKIRLNSFLAQRQILFIC